MMGERERRKRWNNRGKGEGEGEYIERRRGGWRVHQYGKYVASYIMSLHKPCVFTI